MTKPTRSDDLEARYGARAVPPPADAGPLFGGTGAAAEPRIGPPTPQPSTPSTVAGGLDSPPAGRTRPLPNGEASDPWARARDGSEAAARAWTPEQVARVDAAIRTAARSGREFTADDVWGLVGPSVPVTKGLAARLNAAARAGVIVNTGRTATASRGGAHDHAQRLSVWVGRSS